MSDDDIMGLITLITLIRGGVEIRKIISINQRPEKGRDKLKIIQEIRVKGYITVSLHKIILSIV